MKPLLLFFLFLLSNKEILGKVFTINRDVSDWYPTWDSLDKRPLPDWYDKAKVGIFLHWGVYSVPGFGSEWFWADWKSNSPDYVNYIEKNFPPGFSYQEFAKDFKAEFFSPDTWAELFAQSGAKYVVLTSKHHEGFTMWPSSYSFGWNAMDIGPHRDLLGELATAIRNVGLRFGTYYSLYEWFNPRYLADKKKNFTTQDYVDHKMLPELKELIETYKPEVIWSDGDWEAKDEYFRSKDFLAWLYNESPVKESVVANDRWGSGIPCHHGGYYTCTDRYNPGVLQSHKWENCMTVDKISWGYRKNAKISDYLTPNELIKTLVETVSCGGNILINVGPTKEGTIIPVFQERLRQLGEWLKINGEGIYETVPWDVQKDDKTPNVWYTSSSKKDIIYAIVLEWPNNDILELGSVVKLFYYKNTTVQLRSNTLKWMYLNDYVKIFMVKEGIEDAPWGWVLKIKGFK
nr:alpha-L-fucosidase-like [Onthophagus taurus]XP_022920962.1 alpha-L-fucosidase-like [Onthophagus taurus]